MPEARTQSLNGCHLLTSALRSSSEALLPITGFATSVGDGQHLDCRREFAIDDCERKPLKKKSTSARGLAVGRLHNHVHGAAEGINKF